MTRITIRVGEQPGNPAVAPAWLHTIGDYGGVKVAKRHPYGDWALSWSMDLYGGVQPAALAQGRIVEGWLGGTRIFGGRMAEPDWRAGTFSANGLNRGAETAYATDFAAQQTSSPGDAIYFAAARGIWPIGTLESFAGTALPPASEVNYLGALLDQWCALNGKNWLVDSHRQLRLVDNPTTPTLFVASGEDLGVTTEVQATDILVGYQNLLTKYVSQWVSVPNVQYRVEKIVDLVHLGLISDAQATAYANDILAQAGGQAAFSGSITVSAGQVTNGGGVPVHPALIVAGHMYRLQGVRDPRSTALATDVVMGESVWDEDAGTVQLTPLGADRKDFQAVLESITGSAAA